MNGWKITAWNCVCGRRHAPWWGTVQAPTCTVVKPWVKRPVVQTSR